MGNLNILILGGAGFIGSHLAQKMINEGNHVRCVDLKYPKFLDIKGAEFMIADLRDPNQVKAVFDYDVDEVYQLAAQMGGAGYVFSGANDADIFSSSALINLNIANEAVKKRAKKLFFSSSACAYSQDFQTDSVNNPLSESMAWPANPDSIYGIEKLMAEQLYLAYARNYNLNIRIARFHNIFGDGGEFYNGREKAPAAITRKVIMAKDGDTIEVWGDGKQVRTFLYIDDCLDAVELLMQSEHKTPINIGSEEAISIQELTLGAIKYSGKRIKIKNIDGPTGVAGRSSDNTLIKEVLSWEPKTTLGGGMVTLYDWMEGYIKDMPLVHEMNPDTNEIRSFISETDIDGKVSRYYLTS